MIEAVTVAAVRPKSPVVSSTRKLMVNGPPMIATAKAPMPTRAPAVGSIPVSIPAA